MMLHAALVLGFILVAVGFTAYGLLLHLKGSSGAAAVVTACALIGATLWAGFLSAEFFVHGFLMNLVSIEPGLGTMLFSVYWFWKLGAIAIGASLLFAAVVAAGLAGMARRLQPAWLGGGGALFGVLGIVVYALDFLSASATGAPINPMRHAAVRFAVGLPLQLWLIGTGVLLLREWYERAPAGAAAGGSRRDVVQTTGVAPKAALDQKPGLERQKPQPAPAAPQAAPPSAPGKDPLPPPIP
jgi:hypothetical protein